MPRQVLLPSRVRSQRQTNRNRAFEWPVGIDSDAGPWLLDPVEGTSCTVGHYWRWDEGWVDDDGLMQKFRGGIAFPMAPIAEKSPPAGIERATLHFSMLSAVVQVGSYDNPVSVLGARTSVLEDVFLWESATPFDALDFFGENQPLLPPMRNGHGLPRHDATTQSVPRDFHMAKVTIPKVPPIHVPGTPFVASYLYERNASAFRVKADGDPWADYWIDVTDRVQQQLGRYRAGGDRPAPVEEVGFVLAQSAEGLGDPDTDITNIQMSLYGNFKLAVFTA